MTAHGTVVVNSGAMKTARGDEHRDDERDGHGDAAQTRIGVFGMSRPRTGGRYESAGRPSARLGSAGSSGAIAMAASSR